MPMGVYNIVRNRIRAAIYTAWVSALLIRLQRVFLRPQMADEQE